MYSHYFDGKMFDSLVDLFTDDAISEFGPNYGVAFGLGKPSTYPAIPEDRPWPRYAIVGGAAVTASSEMVTETSNLALSENTNPILTSLSMSQRLTAGSYQAV